MGSQQKCRACDASIIFVKNEKTGRTGPCQPVRTIYVFIGQSEVRPLKVGEALPEYGLMISHFETCPQPGLFSKRGKSDAS